MHVMFDLETWGTRPGAALRSIGAVVFSPMPDSKLGDTFYRNISDESCAAIGLIFDPDTVEWWKRQSAEASNHLHRDPRQIDSVVSEFHQWFRQVGAQFIWCHGANFDEPLWTAVAHRLKQVVPWKFWNVRCTRTCYAMNDFDPRSFLRQGTHHNALDDAVHQARCVQAAMNRKAALAA